jgi:hypothetical protein
MAIQYTIYLAGLGFVWGNTLTDTLSNLPAKQHEQGNALMNTSQQFAGSVGVALVSTIVAFKQRQAGTKYGLPTALGTQYSFWVLLVIGLICGLLIIRFEGQGKKHNK